MSRFTKHLFFCINDRGPDNPKGSCSQSGAPVLIDYAKKRSNELGLKGKIRINKAGCLNACSHGPAVVVYPEDLWYTPKTIEDVEEILQKTVLENKTVDRLSIEFKKKISL
jgi:(2Fe-2S) ferredoxin